MVPGPLAGLHILHKPSHFVGCSGSSILSLRLSCPAACRILVPLPGKEPMFKALESRFLTTGPPGKSLHSFLTSSILQLSAEPTQLRGERPVLIGLLLYLHPAGNPGLLSSFCKTSSSFQTDGLERQTDFFFPYFTNSDKTGFMILTLDVIVHSSARQALFTIFDIQHLLIF